MRRSGAWCWGLCVAGVCVKGVGPRLWLGSMRLRCQSVSSIDGSIQRGVHHSIDRRGGRHGDGPQRRGGPHLGQGQEGSWLGRQGCRRSIHWKHGAASQSARPAVHHGCQSINQRRRRRRRLGAPLRAQPLETPPAKRFRRDRVLRLRTTGAGAGTWVKDSTGGGLDDRSIAANETRQAGRGERSKVGERKKIGGGLAVAHAR